MKGLRALAFGALALAGCNLTALAERDNPIAVNHCSANAACPSGQQCSGGQCIATRGSLSTLLFEVSPSAQAGALASTKLFQIVEDVPFGGGAYGLVVGDLATVDGHVSASLPADCDVSFLSPDGANPNLKPLADGEVPVRVTFAPSERGLGLSATSVTASVALGGSEYKFQTQLPGGYPGGAYPGGTYDLYIEPFAIDPASPAYAQRKCALPPLVLRAQAFEGRKDTTLKLTLPTPAQLDLSVRWPASGSNLDGWAVDMLEPVSGRVTSTRGLLAAASADATSLVYTLGIEYQPVVGDDPNVTGGELVRLSPPANTTAPSFYFHRTVLEWSSPGSGVIDGLGPWAPPVSLTGQVVDEAFGMPVPASLTFTAQSIIGVPDGTFASFTRSVLAAADGSFSLDLLPGSYRVLIAPIQSADGLSTPYATSEMTWDVAATPSEQAGRLIQLTRATVLNGEVLTSNDGSGARGTVVSTEVSASWVTTSVLERALGNLPLVPGASNAVIDDVSGAFSLFVDSGVSSAPAVFDFSARPPSASGFAWLVIPRLAVRRSPLAPLAFPESQRLPAPVRLDLAVGVGDSATVSVLVGAAVRAYALLDDSGAATTDPKAAKSAVAVAEARLDQQAHATLMLPAALDAAPTGFAHPASP